MDRDDVSAFGDDVSVDRDDVSAFGDDVSAIRDDAHTFLDDRCTLLAVVSAIGDDVSAIRDDVSAIGDDVSWHRGNVSASRDDVSLHGGNADALRGDRSGLLAVVSSERDDVSLVRDDSNALLAVVSMLRESSSSLSPSLRFRLPIVLFNSPVDPRSSLRPPLDAAAPLCHARGEQLPDKRLRERPLRVEVERATRPGVALEVLRQRRERRPAEWVVRAPFRSRRETADDPSLETERREAVTDALLGRGDERANRLAQPLEQRAASRAYGRQVRIDGRVALHLRAGARQEAVKENPGLKRTRTGDRGRHRRMATAL